MNVMNNFRFPAPVPTPLAHQVAELEREHHQLVNGAASQAKTIRTLNERNSSLEAEVTIEKYNVEFLKNQGRKTRDKVRGFKKLVSQLRNHLGQALDRAERAEKANDALRQALGKGVAQQAQLLEKVDKLEAAIDRMVEGEPLPFQFVTEQKPFRVVLHSGRKVTSMMDNLEVTQLGLSMRIAPEHRRDLLAHAEIARDAAKQLSERLELEILSTLRGEKVTHKDIAEARKERLMQQYQDPYNRSFSVYGF